MLKNLTTNFIKSSLLAVVTLSILSCTTPSRSTKEIKDIQLSAEVPILNSPEEMGPPAPVGPSQVDALKPSEGTAYGPEPFEAKAIVLVLGPGLAKGFAHVGVLRALQEEKIPVAAIVATEMGALIGALYAQANSINSFEWSLQKFKPEYFQEKSGVFFQKNDSLPQKLKAEIEKSFGNKKFKDLKKPVKILLLQNKSLFIASEGTVNEAVVAALTGNGYYSESSYQSKPTTGSTLERPYPVSEAQALGLGPVVVVDLLTNETMHPDKVNQAFASAAKIGEKDLNEAALIIRPALSGIGYLDFSKKSEAIFKGKSAIKDNLKRIRPLAGLPGEKFEEEKANENN